MSKYELQEQTLQASGVSFEESQAAISLQPSLYERIGTHGFQQLSALFYERVFEDDQAPWFLNIFSSSTKSEAIENQVGKQTFESSRALTVSHINSISTVPLFCSDFWWPRPIQTN
jgi:hypothetical protein